MDPEVSRAVLGVDECESDDKEFGLPVFRQGWIGGWGSLW